MNVGARKGWRKCIKKRRIRRSAHFPLSKRTGYYMLDDVIYMHVHMCIYTNSMKPHICTYYIYIKNMFSCSDERTPFD